MKRTADRLFGDNYRWSVLGAGASQMKIAAQAAALGGHVRVGLEDNLWLDKGVLAPSNAAQVTRVRKIIEGLGLETGVDLDALADVGRWIAGTLGRHGSRAGTAIYNKNHAD